MPRTSSPRTPESTRATQREQETSGPPQPWAGGSAVQRSRDVVGWLDMAPDRAMVIVAHPDDAEFLVAGTAALWAAGGPEVNYGIVTNGDKGSEDPSMTSEQLAALREDEQRRAAAGLGVKEVLFLGYED